MTAPRRRALRAVMSALAGGGLTAAGLGGPVAPGAFGAVAPASATGSTDRRPSAQVTVPGRGTQETAAGRPSSTTPTTPPAAPSGTTGPQVSSPTATGAAPEPPIIVLRRRQKSTPAKSVEANVTPTRAKPRASKQKKKRVTHAVPVHGAHPTPAASRPHAVASGPNNVALPPQLVAGQAEALAAQLASSAASAQALAFYRIPLFLLPIYQAAGAQYGVPWQILAAINEIETDYGSDQSVSTAGAVGWMQFEPSTWSMYGVDALDAGYADPYNPVDAIFAAARYLRAAGAAQDLRTAILAYNHSNEYADSVLLRAKLISTYPKPVIATLTGLVDDRPPVTGTQLAWGAPRPLPSSATGNASSVRRTGSSGTTQASTPGASAPPTPGLAAAAGIRKVAPTAPPLQVVDLLSARNAAVVAVQGGRIMRLGHSHALGRYVILRDLFGDVFTYAGLGSIAPSYSARKLSLMPANGGASGRDPRSLRPATAGAQPPLTLHVKTPVRQVAPSQDVIPGASAESTPRGMGKVRLFAHPDNPDAIAAAATAASRARAAAEQSTTVGDRLRLQRGSVVAEGTVLGRVLVPQGAKDGHMRFAIRPAGDAATVDPRGILANWIKLDTTLHPQGAKGESKLLAAMATEAFGLPKAQLEREVLADAGIGMSACARDEVGSGLIDRRVLAVLAFLSRSGLQPTVGTLRCGGGSYDVAGYVSGGHVGDAVAISHINGVPIAGHQGAGSIADATIRMLLALRGEFAPRQIVSLMQYPGHPSTHARPDHAGYIELAFQAAPKRATTASSTATKAAPAHSAAAAQAATSQIPVSNELSPAQWEQLVRRIAALPAPKVSTKPSSSAIRDPKGP